MKIKMLMLLVVILTGCATSAVKSPQWIKSIGTDDHAGGIERLELDNLLMDWSTSRKGVGWLSLVEPGTNEIVWSSPGPLPVEKHGRSIRIQDGDIITVVHKSGREFEIKIVKQTDFYIKVMYRNLGESSLPKNSEPHPDKYTEGISYLKSWSPHPINQKYYKLWVDLFIKANNLKDEDIVNNLKIIFIANPKTLYGDGLDIRYSIRKDWFLSQQEGSYFPIRIGKDNHAYQSLINRRDVNLTKEDLIDNIDDLHLKTDKFISFVKASSKVPLKFSSEEEAVFALSEALHVDSLKHINREIINGNPILSTSLTVNRNDNKCRFANINLISGEADIRDSACVVY